MNFELFYEKLKDGRVEPIDVLSYDDSNILCLTSEVTHYFRIRPNARAIECSQKDSTFVCFELNSREMWKVARFDEEGPKYYLLSC